MPTLSKTRAYGDLLTSTLDTLYEKKEIRNAVLVGTPFFKFLKDDAITLRGGAEIRGSVRTGTRSGTFKSFQHYDSLDPSPTTYFQPYFYTWKCTAITVMASGQEMRENAGSEEQVFNLWQERYDAAVEDMTDGLADMIFSDGSGNGGKDTNGVANIISTSPTTGTVGGIDRSTTTGAYWRNKATSSGSFASQGLDDFRTMWTTVWDQRNMGKPTLIVTTALVANAYEKIAQPLERFAVSSSTGKAPAKGFDLGFDGMICYKGAPVVWDPKCPTGRAYFVNENCLKLAIHNQADFKPSPKQSSYDQDAYLQYVISQLELFSPNPRHLGVVYNITA